MSTPPVHLSQRAQQTADQPISYFMQQAVENPRLISLAAGLVDSASLPADEVADAVGHLLIQPHSAQAALQYGTTHGYGPFREKLLSHVTALDHVTPRELSLTAEDVVVTTGSQQLLYLLTELLFDPGDIVITEAPAYFVYHGTLSSHGVRTLTVPMDDEGMNIDALEELLQRLAKVGELERVRLIYTCDYFQNPTGLTLSLPRRKRLVELVKRYSQTHRILILEDAAYRELRYDGTDIPSIKSFDPDNTFVLLAMTFSKPCAPGLKTGYGVLPRELVAPLLRLKGNHDFGSNNFTQHILDRLLATKEFDHHLRLLCDVYRRKRDVMLEALAEEFGEFPEIQWTHPHGGLYVWVRFPTSLETGPNSRLMKAALHEGVLYVPGQFCYVNGENGPVMTNEMRLSFGLAQAEAIREAIHRLGRAVRQVAEEATLMLTH